MKKRTLSLLLALALCLGLLVVPAGAAQFTRSKTYTPGQFTDVASSAWYAPSVKDCFELGLMSGNSATTFNPGGLFTLAEAATIAGRMHSIYTGGGGVLPTAAGPWYQGAVDYCVKNGIFAADEFDGYARNATRAEMAGIMANALPDSAWTAKNSVTALPDVNRATDYADAIFKLYDAGVFTGSDDYGMFQPYANITRAEVAAIVARCADQSQRKTLALKPLSQRQAPMIPGGYLSGAEMSAGRLKFKDPDTEKYGYLDGNGNVAIPAIYDSVWNSFQDGYAGVKLDGKWGLVDPSGQVTVPIEYREISTAWAKDVKSYDYGVVANGRLVTPLKYDDDPESMGGGLYRVYDNSHYGVVNSAGQEIIPCQYSSVKYTGLYCIGNTYANSVYTYNVHNTAGQLLNTYSCNDFKWAKNSPLFAVQEGNKWALATANGKVTEALYDSVELTDNSNLAVIKNGSLVGLAGANGIILEPMKYNSYYIKGDYMAIQADDEDRTVAIVTTTGPVSSFTAKGTGDFQRLYATEDGYRVLQTYYDDYLLDRNWQYVGRLDRDAQPDRGYLIYDDFAQEGDNQLYFIDGKKYTSIYSGGGGKYLYASYDPETYEYTYVPALADAISSGETYATASEAEEAYDAAQAAYRKSAEYLKQLESEKKYSIRNNSAGKPCVYYGSDATDWAPVIESYKSGFYYDEIRDIDEGYYACRFNTTWYLVHP